MDVTDEQRWRAEAAEAKLAAFEAEVGALREVERAAREHRSWCGHMGAVGRERNRITREAMEQALARLDTLRREK